MNLGRKSLESCPKKLRNLPAKAWVGVFLHPGFESGAVWSPDWACRGMSIAWTMSLMTTALASAGEPDDCRPRSPQKEVAHQKIDVPKFPVQVGGRVVEHSQTRTSGILSRNLPPLSRDKVTTPSRRTDFPRRSWNAADHSIAFHTRGRRHTHRLPIFFTVTRRRPFCGGEPPRP